MRLKENQVIEQSLDLQRYMIPSLPDGLTIKGDLNLWNSGIQYIGNNITVLGNVSLRDCDKLISIGENFKVGGSLYLGGCVNLERVGKGLRVDYHISLLENKKLKELPESLIKGDLYNADYLEVIPKYIGGSLEIYRDKIYEQDTLEVGGHLIFKGVSRLPKRIRVQGALHIKLCDKLYTLPSDIEVKGEMRIIACDSLEGIPAMIRVGSLYNPDNIPIQTNTMKLLED